MKNIINGIRINQLLHLTLLLGAFCSINLFSMRMTEKGMAAGKAYWAQQTLLEKQARLEREEAISRKRGLLIFLDEQEKGKFGAVSSNLLTALYQEAGPIIVSTSLLYGLREYWQKDSRPIEDLLDQYDTNYLYKKKDEGSESLSNIILSRVCFKEERWIIKKINNSLNLFIPLRHLQSLKVNQDEVKKFDSTMETNEVSAIELQLGLKVNHMETIDFRSIVPSYYAQISTYFFSSQLASYFVNSLDIIFCKKSDYINQQITIPEWCIFMDGHGGINEAIAYLSLNDFKKFLNFLEKEIITQLLVVISCYAAGVNVNKIYGELKLGTQQYYAFPIIIQGFNDISTGGHFVRIDWSAWQYQKKISLDTKISFFDFLEKAKRSEGNYNEIIKPVFYDYYIHNTPQIKLPGLEWFSVMDLRKNIVAIGSILAQTRDPQKVLNLIKQKPKAILLYTDNIPFELQIDLNSLSDICSMVSSGPMKDNPEFVIHRIKKIFINKYGDFGLLLNKIRFGGSKWFFIDEVQVQIDNNIYKNVLIFHVKDKSDAFTYFTGREPIKCYFEDENNNLFTQGSSREKEKSTFWDKWDYESKMSEVRKYLELSQKKSMMTPEQITKIEDVLAKQLEGQKKLKEEAYTVSEPEVD